MASSTLYPPLSIEGWTVLITGASAGIGLAAARRFAEAGSRLVLVARRAERLEQLKEELQAQYKVDVHNVVADLSVASQVERLAAELPPAFQEVDILLNNAGLALGTAPVQAMASSDAVGMISTNVTAVVILTRELSKGMVERNRGHIINVSSIAGHTAYPGGSVYCGTKHFVNGFTDCARHDLVGTAVRVSAISPGAVNTEFSTVRYKGDKSKADAVYAGIVPLNADDIADNILYAATRPLHVQVGDIVVFATNQSGPQSIARILLEKSKE
ncbi:hypothetical protein WJX81_000553 [Elliptochloris bilobata]|uniref:Ketoreductase domain-containing protein n=1 Tax=Elliptochloris bilobata TaxID=381761 RepID=A0AAW1QWK9_9CHLO